MEKKTYEGYYPYKLVAIGLKLGVAMHEPFILLGNPIATSKPAWGQLE